LLFLEVELKLAPVEYDILTLEATDNCTVKNITVKSFKMLVQILLCASFFNAISAVSMITLPSAEVDKIHKKLVSEKPYVLLTPNDATLESLSFVDIEKHHHGEVKHDGAKNLVELAESLNLTVLVKALEETGLDNIIDHEGKFTLFAPSDEAFRNIPEWAGKILLKDLLRFHVARGLIYADDISNDLLARSLLSKRDIRMNVYKDGKVITANGSPITAFNYTAHNGVLHIIDCVMVSVYERKGSIPNELRRCPKFNSLSKLLSVADLESALHGKGPFTLFAPSDDAFAKLPADIVEHLVHDPAMLRQVLQYHVATGTWYGAGLEDGMSLGTLGNGKLPIHIADGNVIVGKSSKVVMADNTASNGVIHSIDSVLLPPSIKKKLMKSMKKSSHKHLKGADRD